MKKLLPFWFLLIFATAQSQEQITLKFIRPSISVGASDKISISVLGNEYLIGNGNTILVNVSPDFSTSLKIDVSVSSGIQTNYYLEAAPGQTYNFEVGFKMTGIYIKQISDDAVKNVQQVNQNAAVNNNEGWNTKLKVDRNNKSIFTAEKTGNSEVRDNFLLKGGKVSYNSIMLTGTYLRIDLKSLGSSGAINSYGGGISSYTNFITLKIPEYKPGLSTWNSFNWGLGYDMVIYSYKFSMKPDPSLSMDMSSLAFNMLINLNLGWTWGLGKFLDENNWKGVAITVKYRPSLTLNNSFTTTNTKSTLLPSMNGKKTSSASNVSFSGGGFGFDIDFSNFTSTMDKKVPKPSSKIGFFFLPPTSKSPLFISLSYGMIIYPQKKVKR